MNAAQMTTDWTVPGGSHLYTAACCQGLSCPVSAAKDSQEHKIDDNAVNPVEVTFDQYQLSLERMLFGRRESRRPLFPSFNEGQGEVHSSGYCGAASRQCQEVANGESHTLSTHQACQDMREHDRNAAVIAVNPDEYQLSLEHMLFGRRESRRPLFPTFHEGQGEVHGREYCGATSRQCQEVANGESHTLSTHQACQDMREHDRNAAVIAVNPDEYQLSLERMLFGRRESRRPLFPTFNEGQGEAYSREYCGATSRQCQVVADGESQPGTPCESQGMRDQDSNTANSVACSSQYQLSLEPRLFGRRTLRRPLFPATVAGQSVESIRVQERQTATVLPVAPVSLH